MLKTIDHSHPAGAASRVTAAVMDMWEADSQCDLEDGRSRRGLGVDLAIRSLEESDSHHRMKPQRAGPAVAWSMHRTWVGCSFPDRYIEFQTINGISYEAQRGSAMGGEHADIERSFTDWHPAEAMDKQDFVARMKR